MSILLTDDFDFNYNPDTKNIEILNTFVGENKLYPTFGTRLQDILGYNPSPNFIKYTIKQAILKDSRYKEVTDIKVVRQSGKSVSISATVKIATSGELLQITGEING
jgi:hypothetical protein